MTVLFLCIAILQFLASLFYVRDALAGRSKPNKVTFFFWTLAPAIAFAIGISEGFSWALVPVLMAGVSSFVIFLSSFFNPQARWKLGALDYVCGALTLCAIIFWVFADQPILALIFAVLSDLLPSIPTLFKAWSYPETETGIAYVPSLIGAILGLILLPQHTFLNSAFLAYIVVTNTLFVCFIFRKKFGALQKKLYS